MWDCRLNFILYCIFEYTICMGYNLVSLRVSNYVIHILYCTILLKFKINNIIKKIIKKHNKKVICYKRFICEYSYNDFNFV